MVLEAFTGLIAVPVHEEAVLQVDHGDGADHDAGDPEGRQSGEKAEEEPDRTEKFGGYDQRRYDQRHPHRLGEEGEGSLETVAAEPAEGLLGSMREKDDGEHQAKYKG